MDATLILDNVLTKFGIDAIILMADHLYDASLVLKDFSSWSRIVPIIKRLNSCSLWPSFGWSTMRKLSEGPVLIIGSFKKVELELIYFYVVRKKMKNYHKLFKNCSIPGKNC